MHITINDRNTLNGKTIIRHIGKDTNSLIELFYNIGNAPDSNYKVLKLK